MDGPRSLRWAQPGLARLPFRGKRRLIEKLPLWRTGSFDVRLPGDVLMHLDMRDRVQRLMAFRAYEPAEVDCIERLLRPGDVVFDCGAHIGYHALHAARAVGSSGAVHTFEPYPPNAERLRHNVALNDVRHVHVVEAAVGRAPGASTFRIPRRTGETGWGSLLLDDAADMETITVDVVTLDEYVQRNRIGMVRFIKLDIQGGEMDALAGAERVLERDRPDLLCEVDDVWWGSRQRHTARDLLSFLRDRGYRAWRPHGRRRLDPIPEDATGRNILFSTREHPFDLSP